MRPELPFDGEHGYGEASDELLTLDIYTHMASGAQREAVERLEHFLLFPTCSQIAAERVENGELNGCKDLM